MHRLESGNTALVELIELGPAQICEKDTEHRPKFQTRKQGTGSYR